MKRHGSRLAHFTELLLIATAVGMGVGMLGLMGWVLFPQVVGISGGDAPTPGQSAALSEAAAPTEIAPTATTQITSTPLPSPSPLPVLETPAASPTVAAVAVSASSCDRPGWFPKNMGLNEHTLIATDGGYIALAARQPLDHRLLAARSTDLCHWEALPDALTEMQKQAWDGKGVDAPFMFEQDGLYHLFYTGVTWAGTERILWATTSTPQDSASWQVQGEAFRPNHAGEDWPAGREAWCRDAMVLRDGDLYYLYYAGRDTGGGMIGAAVANSPAGPWKDMGAIVPVLADQDYDSPFVAAYDGNFYLFYHHPGQGTQYRIGPSPTGPWSDAYDLAPGWAHEIWQEDDGQWRTSFLTDYTVTVFPLAWELREGVLHPQIITPSPFLQDVPIWSHSGEPSLQEVNLFRQTFSLDQPLTEVEVALFADTRYEAWLDGEWLGRGPARFSYQLREYDIYPLGELAAGEHSLAVLVQWSPNIRRSESIAPFLQGHLRGLEGTGREKIVRTSADWQVQRSDAWQSDAALVHSWGLIGSTELLDLSLLPADWMQADFDDHDWPLALAINPLAVNYQPHRNVYLGGEPLNGNGGGEAPTLDLEQAASLDFAGAVSGVTYRARSIPILENVSMPVRVLYAGYFSPGQRMVEIPPGIEIPYDLPFRVEQDTTVTLEAPGVIGPAVSITIDGERLAWLKAGDDRPEVYQAHLKLFRGAHTLTLEKSTSTGSTFSISTENLSLADWPFAQGVHAGRRVLTGAMLPDLDVFAITAGDGLTITTPAGPSYLVLDVGRTVNGRLVADVEGAAGTLLDIGWDERLAPGTTRPLPFPGSLNKDWNQVDSWRLDGSPRPITTLDTRSGRYVLIVVWSDEPVTLRNLRLLEERYPLEVRGSFQSSDPLLNQIWQVGLDTLYSNMNDAYTDTSWRERGQWWGDAYVSAHVNRVVFGDFALMRRGLDYMADSYRLGFAPGLAPNSSSSNMTDYMMLWVQDLADYVQLSGDRSILDSTYPVLQEFMAQMATYEQGGTGLLSFPQRHWWQYVYVDMYGWHNRYGQATAFNAIYYGTLLKAAYLAEQAGDLTTALWWRGKAERVYESANDLLYSPAKGSYMGTYYQGYYEQPNVHAQVWPLAYGLTTDENQEAVVAAVLDLLSDDPTRPNMGIYGLYWVLDGLGRSGHIEEALDLIRIYYGYMLGRGATTWWERWDADRAWSQSQSHAWGGAPTWFLTTYVLGARATGVNIWELRPALAHVESVSGAIPLGEAQLSASWQHPACGQDQIQIGAPQGSVGRLMIPLQPEGHTIEINDRLVWMDGLTLDEQVRLSDGMLAITLPAGHYSIRSTYTCP